MASCPLCAQPEHVGRCERPPVGYWWCGACLEEAVKPADGELPPSVILAAGVKLTSKWCRHCGAPLCTVHRKDGGVRSFLCLEECRERPAKEHARLAKLVETHNPRYLEEGPTRCRVCTSPVFKKALCTRHYSQVRRGRLELLPERQRSLKGEGNLAILPVKLPKEMAVAAAELALADGKSRSKFIADLIHREIFRRKGTDLRRGRTLFTYESDD
jgi:hypothetical protein